MSESLWNGPSQIRPDPGGVWFIKQQPNHGLRLNFTFHALWENMVYVCNAATGDILATKGNYFRDQSDMLPDFNNTEGEIWFAVVGYHKHVSPDAGDAGEYPWHQSRLTYMGYNQINDKSAYELIGFNDNDTGYPPDNVRITVNHFGGLVVPRNLPHHLFRNFRPIR